VDPIKILKKINSFFLYDEETGERGTLSDHIVFYMMLSAGIIGMIIYTYKLITF